MENTIKLLREDILCKEELINEAKRIGIDKLPFGYQSLKSFIDGKTMNVHYNGHYKTYVKKLNDALSKKNYGDIELEEIIKSISKYNDTIRNNAGGAFNHALFWKMLSPKKQEIPQNLKTKINKDFGSYNEFKKEFEDVAKKIFGSGWAWLVLTKQGKLKVMSTPNQDNPLMNVIKGGGFPLLGLDTWEHAYYLKYQNKRDEYINNFWGVINWEFVNDLYLKRQKSKLTESIRIIKESNDGYIQPNGNINPKIIQEFLTNIYPKCSPEIITDYDPTKRVTNACWGKIQSNDCKTTYGVIGGKYAVSTRGGVGEWSVINWFDGNQKVGNKIKEIFEKDNPDNDDFNIWMDKNNTKLFSEDGDYIDTLINVISNIETKKGTLDRGIELENITEKILNKKDISVTRFCDGDVRDKFEGKDFSIIDNGVEKFIQVKRLDHLQIIKTPNNYTNYIFISKNLYRKENIQIFAFVESEKNYLFFENKGVYKKTNDGYYKYTFFSREKILTNDMNESKFDFNKAPLRKIISEIIYLDGYNDLITELCNYKTGDTIYCRFKNVADNIGGNERNEVLNAADTIINFYYPEISTRLSDYKTQRNLVFGRGIITKILELALQNDLPGNFVKAIAAFINDDKFDKSETEKRLLRLKSRSDIKTEKLDEFLSEVREKAYSRYEKQLTGDYMEKYTTALNLDYKCEKIDERNFVDVVESAKNGDKELPTLVNDLVFCITKSMKNENPIKADLKATHDYYYKNKKIFSLGDIFEVKMMDTRADSYLSEFFSIFKTSKIINKIKNTHLDVYNEIIDNLYLELYNNKVANDFLNKVRNNLAGVFFDKNIVVPIKHIKLYWSNKGQKGCKEKRLSIRFKIVGQDVKSYVYNPNSTQLELNRNSIKPEDFKEIRCW